MEKEIKFAPIDIDEELAKIGMPERMRDIIEYAIKENLGAREALSIMEREINLINEAVSLENKIAREEYVRRRLGAERSPHNFPKA
ncbi:hypothetical protein [Escherichia coli]|uniref:hypothetical protein n=1 Tax=Escherichia coli TaxID=562 RepID=UPI0010CB199C|nr:hypothetical protein [Escherichia coli]GDQ96244.1 hypothetical protein BvCmsNSP045_04989 [Escherichia coli]